MSSTRLIVLRNCPGQSAPIPSALNLLYCYAPHSPTIFYSDSSILPEDLANQSVRLKEEQLRKEEEKVWNGLESSLDRLIDCSYLHSCTKLSSKSNVRSTKRGKSCWQKKSHSGQRRYIILRVNRFTETTFHRNLESRLAAQSQSENRN